MLPPASLGCQASKGAVIQVVLAVLLPLMELLILMAQPTTRLNLLLTLAKTFRIWYLNFVDLHVFWKRNKNTIRDHPYICNYETQSRPVKYFSVNSASREPAAA